MDFMWFLTKSYKYIVFMSTFIPNRIYIYIYIFHIFHLKPMSVPYFCFILLPCNCLTFISLQQPSFIESLE